MTDTATPYTEHTLSVRKPQWRPIVAARVPASQVREPAEGVARFILTSVRVNPRLTEPLQRRMLGESRVHGICFNHYQADALV